MKFIILGGMIFLSLSVFGADRADDGTLIGIMDEITQELIDHEHDPKTLNTTLKHLQEAKKTLMSEGKAVLTISNGPFYDFAATVVQSQRKFVFTLFNSGSQPATQIQFDGLLAPFQFAGGNFPGNGGTCPPRLFPGSSCTFVLSFTPTQVGAYQNHFSIHFHNGKHQAGVTRALQG